MERNPYITLAHVNPEIFTPIILDTEHFCSIWFIGLAAKQGETLNINFTDDIQIFLDTSNYLNIVTKFTYFKWIILYQIVTFLLHSRCWNIIKWIWNDLIEIGVFNIHTYNWTSLIAFFQTVFIPCSYFLAKRQAEQIRLLKKGMTLEARYIKKRELKNFISPSLIKRNRNECK